MTEKTSEVQELIDAALAYVVNMEHRNIAVGTAAKNLVKAIEPFRKLNKPRVVTVEPDSPPWKCGELNNWSLVGMNHYHIKEKRFLFVAMTKDDKCITAEGLDDNEIWKRLEEKALKESNK